MQTKLQIIGIIAKINNLQQQAIVQPSSLVQQAGEMAEKLGKEEIVAVIGAEEYAKLKQTQSELKTRIAAINVKAAESIPDFPE